MSARSSAFTSLVALAVFARMAPAWAAPTEDVAEASRLFQEAKELIDQGRFAEACPKLDRSRRLDPQVGTTLNLAFCYERLGKTASSWSTWLDGATEAAARGQAAREALARRMAAQLETRLLRVTILVDRQPGLQTIDLRLDGVSIPKTQWGAPTPVDPGVHWVQATADGKRPWLTTIEVDDQHVPIVRVTVLHDLSEPPEESPGGGGRGLAPRRVGAVALAGAGIAALAGMTVLGLLAKSSYQTLDCVGTSCLPQGLADRDRAYTEAGLATAAGVTAAAALTGAAVLWFGGGGHAEPNRVTLGPAIGRDGCGVSLGGSW
jgi:hypothetical protein